jgi:phage gp46-like protein
VFGIVSLVIGTCGLTCEQSSLWDRASDDRNWWVDLRAEQCVGSCVWW